MNDGDIVMKRMKKIEIVFTIPARHTKASDCQVENGGAAFQRVVSRRRMGNDC